MNTRYTERTNELYQEPAEGLSWAMLDFDDIELSEGLSPTSIDAIEFVIAKLPAPFQDVSYLYQFSSSTGILREDGTPWKEGLNVHLFFYFSKPIKGTLLEAYLKQHCIQTGFFEKTKDRAGSPVIRYGVDFSLFRAVQPHYVAAPIIENGVICTLEESQRQRLISKVKESVDVPELAADLPRQVKIDHRKLWDQHKRECGWVKTYALTKPIRGSSVAIHDYYHNPNSATISTGRELVEVKASGGENDEIQYATLYFSGEKSPGSWYVSKKTPVSPDGTGTVQKSH